MDDNIAGGDSQAGTEVMEMGIDLGSGQINPTPTVLPGETIQQDSAQAEQETVPPTEANGTQGQEEKASDAPDGPYTAEYYKQRRNTIVALEQYFKDLQGGRITDRDLKKVFEENPTLAEAARKSKVLKDPFRALMEGKLTTPSAARKPETDTDDLDDTEERPISADPGSRVTPETSSRLSTEEERIADAIYQKLRSEKMREQADSLALHERQMKEKIAVKYGFKDAEYDKFSSLVDSLSGVDGIETEQAISHAVSIMRPSKGTPVNVAGSMPPAAIPEKETGMYAEDPTQIIDLTKL